MVCKNFLTVPSDFETGEQSGATQNEERKSTTGTNSSEHVGINGKNFLVPSLNNGYLLRLRCARLNSPIAWGLAVSNRRTKARNRCCFAREITRKRLTSVA